MNTPTSPPSLATIPGLSQRLGDLNSPRILIIDDTRAIHDDFGKILARQQNSSFEKSRAELFDDGVGGESPLSFELDSAYQGQEGLALVERAVELGRPYAVVFADVRMPPGWDGIETAARLWEAAPDLQIVICSAYSDHSWHAIVNRLGNSDSLLILKKPFDPVEIQQLAHALTKKWLLTRQNKMRVAELEAGVAERTIELRQANDKLLGEITESRRAQEQLNLQFSALSAAANAIVIADQHGKIQWVNPAFTRLTGYSIAEAIGGDLCAPSSRHPEGFHASLWSAITAGNVWHGEMIDERKDGRIYTQEMTITPVRGGHGQITHFVAIKQDITERRQLEGRLQQAQKMEAIGTLAGGIAHDFNNILAAIFGYSNILQFHVGADAEAQADIEEILKAASRAKDLVQQILTFSRRREQKREIIQLDTVVREVMKFLRASLPAQIKIETNLAADPLNVLADPTQIYQATTNLATNALHAMEGQAGQLTVTLDSFLPAEPFVQANPQCRRQRYARLTFDDTGHGMDAKTLERIFEPFFTTKPVGKGTGLGLAVVHGIMESHEGFITVESRPGRGTTFCLFFPAQTQSEKSTNLGAAPFPRGHGEKILLVDDEPALMTALQRLLHELNYQAVVADGARGALQLFQDETAHFDLVITDLMMPETNGLQLSRQLRDVRKDLPIILTTGYATGLDREKLQNAGFCGLLEKPFSLDVLAHIIERALARKCL